MKRGHDSDLSGRQIPAVEFSRPVDLEDLPDEGIAVDLTADDVERAAVARRLGLRDIARFGLAGRLMRDTVSDGFFLAGELTAAVTQTCVVSLEPIAAEIRVPVHRSFVLAKVAATPEADGEIDPAAEDPPDPVAGGTADLGEVATEELALALDPYPRKPGAALPDGVLVADGEGEAAAGQGTAGQGAEESPFAVLKRLKH